MTIRAHIDIKENELLRIDTTLLEILLKDMTTGKNLVWATDNYAGHTCGILWHETEPRIIFYSNTFINTRK